MGFIFPQQFGGCCPWTSLPSPSFPRSSWPQPSTCYKYCSLPRWCSCAWRPSQREINRRPSCCTGHHSIISGITIKQIILFSYIQYINTFKYHVSCTDGKISVRIIYFYYLFFHRCPTHKLCFLYCRPFIINATFSTGLVVSSVSWLGQLKFKSLRISIVGFQNFFCCLVWAVDLGVPVI